jgi:hypothetical protein
VVRWASESAAAGTGTMAAEAAVDRLAAIDLLRGGGHDAVVRALRGGSSPSPSATAVERYAMVRGKIDEPLVDDGMTLGLLSNLVITSASFTDSEKFRLERALPDVRALVFSNAAPPVTLDAAEASVRTAYMAVSQLRDRLRSSTFFNADDRRAFPGVDASIATQRLLDDVGAVLRRAENRLFAMRYAASGARVNVWLASDQAVVSENLTVRWEVTTETAPVSWKSITAGVFGEAISPIGTTPVTAAPGAPLRFSTRVMPRGIAGSLRLLTLTAVFENPGGPQARYHFDRSVYIHPPVGITARFPRGRTVQDNLVPIEISIRRHTGSSIAANYFWFSPSGLKLREGNTGQVRFGAADSLVARLHVEIPSPCRPGVFPFTLKFFSGDRDAGTIESSLFKPYQWTYVGPFPADGGIARPFAPELGVNLLQSYDGPNGSLLWRPVPDHACGARGEISLRDLCTDRGTNYLYTVVACAYETDVEARLSATGPAAVYVNGRRVVSVAAAQGDSASAMVHLDPDKNHILVKVIGDRDVHVSFALGNDDNMATDEFNNDLAELAGGYRELTERELAAGTAPSESHRLVTLRFTDAAAASVAVVGSFNGWSPETHRMQKQGDLWELTLSLAPGRYAYRFLVDGKKQVLDPSSAATEPDGYGGRNSVLLVKR